MLHNYSSRQFHITSNGINPSSGFRDMISTKSGPSAASFDTFWAMGKPMWGKWANYYGSAQPLRWRQNGRDSVSNHQPHDCLFNRLFRRRSKKTSKLRVTGLCVGNSPGPVNSPHKWPVTRKMFPFDDVIMTTSLDKSIIPSIGSKYLHSAKSGPNLCQIWHVFGPWPRPYGANGKNNNDSAQLQA